MNDEFPLYPQLNEGGAELFQKLIDQFKERMKVVSEDIIGDLYVDLADHVESDQWTNYRNTLLDGLCDYRNKDHSPYDYKKIRRKMFDEYREEIIKDIGADLVEKIDDLERMLEIEREISQRCQ